MTRCTEHERVQDYLDGDLTGPAADAFRAHLALCPECAAELASFRSLIATLERAPLEIPRPELTGRILERVLPSRVRRRRLVVLGWGYAAALAGVVGGAALWALQPGNRALIETLSVRLSHRLLGSGLFVLNSLGASAAHLATGWGWLRAIGDRLAPLTRALGTVLAEPGVGIAILGAIMACTALLWWMRPRQTTVVGEVRHVGIVGF